jgi:hypothetical protein
MRPHGRSNAATARHVMDPGVLCVLSGCIFWLFALLCG